MKYPDWSHVGKLRRGDYVIVWIHEHCMTSISATTNAYTHFKSGRITYSSRGPLDQLDLIELDGEPTEAANDKPRIISKHQDEVSRG